MWNDKQGGGGRVRAHTCVCICVCLRGVLYLVGLLNALDTSQGPYSQDHGLLGTGPGSLQPMAT